MEKSEARAIMTAALITAGSTVLGAIISGVVALAVSSRQHSKTVALIEYRINQLEKKQDKHNQLIERMTLAEEKIRVANHRIEDLENKE